MKFRSNTIKNLIRLFPNDSELGREFRRRFPKVELCKAYPNDTSLGNKIRLS